MELRGVHAGYGEREVLKGIDLVLNEGFVAVLGPNGSGKTTLLRVISGVLKPSSGRVLIDGEDVSRMKRKDLAKLVTLVSQDLMPIYDYTVEEVVLMGRIPHSIFPNAEDLRIVKNALKEVGMEDFEKRRISSLSSGEMRMVMLARALAQQSKVVLIDELELHLDPKNKREIATVMRKMADMGRVVIAVFHDVQLAFSFADFFIGLKDGHVEFFCRIPKATDLKNLYESDFIEVKGRILPWYD